MRRAAGRGGAPPRKATKETGTLLREALGVGSVPVVATAALCLRLRPAVTCREPAAGRQASLGPPGGGDGLSDLRRCDRELHPGRVGSAGYFAEEPVQGSCRGNLHELGLRGNHIVERRHGSKPGCRGEETFSQILDHDLKRTSAAGACSVCGTAFAPQSSRKLIGAHARRVVHDYKCKQCETAFCRYPFQANARTPSGDKPSECQRHEEALLSFTSLGEFVVTRTEGGPHKCNVCGKGLHYPSSLRIHERIHTGEKPYQCEQCGKAFSCWGSVRRHQRTHTGEKPYTCKECGKAFGSLSGLKGHMIRHTGGGPYKCQECGKVFNSPSALGKHERTHTGERPFLCKYCGKAFICSTSVRKHERTHTGEKPYECKRCGKAFISNSGLQGHMIRHTGVGPYKCKFCGKAFGSPSAVLRHESAHVV